MAIIARDTPPAPFIPAPAGIHSARLAEIVDLGIVRKEQFGVIREAHRVRLIFQLDALMEDGRAFITSAFFNVTLNEKSRLRPFLESWLNRTFTTEEATEGFDLETLVGRTALVQLVHRERNGNIYAEIGSIMALPPGQEATFPDYVTADGVIKLAGTEPTQPHRTIEVQTGADDRIHPVTAETPDEAPGETPTDRPRLLALVQRLGAQIHAAAWPEARKLILTTLEFPATLNKLDAEQLRIVLAYLQAEIEESEERQAMAA